jgi:hypothetical protein
MIDKLLKIVFRFINDAQVKVLIDEATLGKLSVQWLHINDIVRS